MLIVLNGQLKCFRLHEFKWHGTDPENKTRMVPGRDKFQQLAVIPEQFYYNVSQGHQINKRFGCKIFNIFVSICLNICFGCSKELLMETFFLSTHKMFWFKIRTLIFE